MLMLMKIPCHQRVPKQPPLAAAPVGSGQYGQHQKGARKSKLGFLFWISKPKPEAAAHASKYTRKTAHASKFTRQR